MTASHFASVENCIKFKEKICHSAKSSGGTEINFPHEGFPRSGEICPQGVKALALGQAAKIDFKGIGPAALEKAVKPAIIIQTSTYRKSGFDGGTAAAVKGTCAIFLREYQWNMQPDNN